MKAIGVAPVPNYTRDIKQGIARWDALCSSPILTHSRPNLLHEMSSFSEPLRDTHDGLRGFELKDVNGYLLFFGRPR